MSDAIGIQRKRSKGFNLQSESRKINGLPAKYIGRPTRWGNPYWVGKEYRNVFTGKIEPLTEDEILPLYELYAKGMLAAYPDWLEPLRGHNVACFCKKGAKCHRDVLLKLLKETDHDHH